MQTDEEKIPQSVSFFNQPKTSRYMGLLTPGESRKTEMNNLIYTWKANSSPAAHCASHMATAQVMSVFVKQKEKREL
jgi:hypothetical protein